MIYTMICPAINAGVLSLCEKVGGKVKKVNKWLTFIEDWSSGILILTGLSILFYAVFLRYVLNWPTTWQDEIARIFLVWGILIGASATLRANGHIQMDLVYNLFPKSMKKWVDFFSNIVVLSFFICILIFSALLVIQKHETLQTSINGIPLWITYMIMPFFSVLMSIRSVEKILLIFKSEEGNY